MMPLDLPGFSFHHIGVAVHDIEATAQFYDLTGWTRIIETSYDPCQNVRACFYSKDGFPTVELIEAVDETSPMTKILDKTGVGPYHFCYGVDNMEDSIKKLKSLRFMPTSRPVPSTGIPGRRVCFLYNRNFGLIELVENHRTEE